MEEKEVVVKEEMVVVAEVVDMEEMVVEDINLEEVVHHIEVMVALVVHGVVVEEQDGIMKELQMVVLADYMEEAEEVV